MINIKFNVQGLDAIKASLRGLSDKKIKVAAASALNDAARAGYEAASDEMRKVFSRPTPWVLGGVRYNDAARAGYEAASDEMRKVFSIPTPWVLGGVRYKKASIDRLESSVDFDKWGNKTGVTVGHVLAAEIAGGPRKNKRHEVALQRAGILPSGMQIVPGSAARMDQYGNMSGAQIVQIMAWFKSFVEQGYRANMNDKGRAKLGKDNKRTGQQGFQYFVLNRPYGKLQPGIYQRFTLGHGSAVKPVMIFVRPPQYKVRFDFYGVTKRAALAQFDKSFKRYLDQMLMERGL